MPQINKLVPMIVLTYVTGCVVYRFRSEVYWIKEKICIFGSYCQIPLSTLYIFLAGFKQKAYYFLANLTPIQSNIDSTQNFKVQIPC